MGKDVLMKKTSETKKILEAADLNKRFLQAISYFQEWAKHIITISSAIMVLGATLLKDIVRSTDLFMRSLIVLFLVVSYIFLLTTIWKTLQFITYSSRTVLTMNPTIGSGEELAQLKKLFRQAQRFFFLGIVGFSILTLFSFLSWIFGTPI